MEKNQSKINISNSRLVNLLEAFLENIISQIGGESSQIENFNQDKQLETQNSNSSRNILQSQLRSYIGHIAIGSEQSQQENMDQQLQIYEPNLNSQDSFLRQIKNQNNQDITLVFIFPQEQRIFFIILNPQLHVRTVASEFQKVSKPSQEIRICLNDLILAMDSTFREQNIQNSQILMCHLKQKYLIENNSQT